MYTHEYIDQVEGFRGWLAYDGTRCRLAAGGCRVQPGLTRQTIEGLAASMTLKQRLLGINVDGAKCGIDYDPRSPGKAAAVRRFLGFLRDELTSRFSMGGDMGTQWRELEDLARLEGIPSIKYAVKVAQEFTDEEYFARIRMLDLPVGAMTLGQRRAGHALGCAAIAAVRTAGLCEPFTFALQGFGSLGRAAGCTLLEAGMRATAVADEFGCVLDPAGLDLGGMLADTSYRPVTRLAPGAETAPRTRLLELPADVLILAAGADAVSPAQALGLQTPIVVVGANKGLSADVELGLHRRGVFVVPDFVGGVGGSASMEALFGSEHRPEPAEVLDTVGSMTRAIVHTAAERAHEQRTPLRAAATAMASEAPAAGQRPYGGSPFRSVLSNSTSKDSVR